MPVSGADVAVIGNDVANQGQAQRQCVRGDFADAIVGRVRNPDACLFAGGRVDGVEARADPADDSEFRKRGDDLGADRRALKQDAAAAAPGVYHLLLGLALRDDDFDPGLAEQRAFEIDFRIVVVCVEDFRHWGNGMGVAQRKTPASVRAALRLVKWPDRFSGVVMPLPARSRRAA